MQESNDNTISTKEEPLTLAQILRQLGATVLTYRPENMTPEEYRAIRNSPDQRRLRKMLKYRSQPSKKIAALMPSRLHYNIH